MPEANDDHEPIGCDATITKGDKSPHCYISLTSGVYAQIKKLYRIKHGYRWSNTDAQPDKHSTEESWLRLLKPADVLYSVRIAWLSSPPSYLRLHFHISLGTMEFLSLMRNVHRLDRILRTSICESVTMDKF